MQYRDSTCRWSKDPLLLQTHRRSLLRRVRHGFDRVIQRLAERLLN